MIIKKWLVIVKLLYLSNVKVYIYWIYYPVFGVKEHMPFNAKNVNQDRQIYVWIDFKLE